MQAKQQILLLLVNTEAESDRLVLGICKHCFTYFGTRHRISYDCVDSHVIVDCTVSSVCSFAVYPDMGLYLGQGKGG